MFATMIRRNRHHRRQHRRTTESDRARIGAKTTSRTTMTTMFFPLSLLTVGGIIGRKKVGGRKAEKDRRERRTVGVHPARLLTTTVPSPTATSFPPTTSLRSVRPYDYPQVVHRRPGRVLLHQEEDAAVLSYAFHV